MRKALDFAKDEGRSPGPYEAGGGTYHGDNGIRVLGLFLLCFFVASAGLVYDHVANRAAYWPLTYQEPLSWYTWVFLSLFTFLGLGSTYACLSMMVKGEFP